MTSDGIEPPLSDLESEVLPLHHEAFGAVVAREQGLSRLGLSRLGLSRLGLGRLGLGRLGLSWLGLSRLAKQSGAVVSAVGS